MSMVRATEANLAVLDMYRSCEQKGGVDRGWWFDSSGGCDDPARTECQEDVYFVQGHTLGTTCFEVLLVIAHRGGDKQNPNWKGVP